MYWLDCNKTIVLPEIQELLELLDKQVEVPGIEPGSSSTDIGLLRA